MSRLAARRLKHTRRRAAPADGGPDNAGGAVVGVSAARPRDQGVTGRAPWLGHRADPGLTFPYGWWTSSTCCKGYGPSPVIHRSW